MNFFRRLLVNNVDTFFGLLTVKYLNTVWCLTVNYLDILSKDSVNCLGILSGD